MVKYIQIKNSESDCMVSGELIKYLGVYYIKRGSGVYQRSFNGEVKVTVMVIKGSKICRCSIYVFGRGIHVKVLTLDDLKRVEDSIILESDSVVYYSRYHRLIGSELELRGYDRALIDDSLIKLWRVSSGKVLGAIQRNIEEA